MLGMCAASYYGMLKFKDSNVVNSISIIQDGEHKGKLNINVSSSIFTSKNIIAEVKNTQSVFSVSNDDIGENDIDNNVINVKNYIDGSEIVKSGSFVLPAESWKDYNMLDWIISIKSDDQQEDSTQDLFDDLMALNFQEKKATGGMSELQYTFGSKRNSDRVGASNPKDYEIESGSSNVDVKIQKMIDQFGD